MQIWGVIGSYKNKNQHERKILMKEISSKLVPRFHCLLRCRKESNTVSWHQICEQLTNVKPKYHKQINQIRIRLLP